MYSRVENQSFLLEALYKNRVMLYIKKFIISIFVICIVSITNSYASFNQELLNNDLVDQRVKNIMIQNNNNGSSLNLTLIENNISKLTKILQEKYKWVIVSSSNPKSEQEKISYALGLLYRYLCEHKNYFIQKYDTKNFYYPDIDVEPQRWSCYSDSTLLYQEAIRYYTLPDVWTLQTIHVPLANKLWYNFDGFEQYLNGDLLDIASESFFFEWYARVDIVPLVDLTQSQIAKKWSRLFDKMKVFAYVETSQFPFFWDKVMIAVLAKQWDNYIKITTPYEKIRYSQLWNISLLVQSLFQYSVQDKIGQDIVSPQHFDTYYDRVLVEQWLDSTTSQKYKVMQYLTTLWEFDTYPQWYIDFVVEQLKKDAGLMLMLQFYAQSLDPLVK